jgi:hypothetical protein
MSFKSLLTAALLLMPFFVLSQGSVGSFTGDESTFYAQTKQMNQFFRRFNAEEDVSGKRYYEGDAGYHELKLRKKYLNILFDNSSSISTDTRDAFIMDVTSKSRPVFLDFHGKDWFAEVSASFLYKGQPVNIILFLKIQHENLGYKWVISNVYFEQFQKVFLHVFDTTNSSFFLHPLSHELDFMNIHKAFDDPDKIDYYLEKGFLPDYLTLFIEEVKDGNLKFQTVSSVKFHFFQIPRWYFEVSFFNRNSMNSGWLISSMVRIDDNEKKHLIRNYTHDE